MSPTARKTVLTFHVATSVGLIGAITGFLALAVAGLLSGDASTVAAAYPAMQVTTWFVILPLAGATLAIGTLESVTTPWGILRHYWIVWKLGITVVAVVVLVLQLNVIDFMAEAASAALADRYLHERMSLVAHGAGGVLVLLVPLALSVFKPRGTTRFDF
jgi:hypothetical protein